MRALSQLREPLLDLRAPRRSQAWNRGELGKRGRDVEVEVECRNAWAEAPTRGSLLLVRRRGPLPLSLPRRVWRRRRLRPERRGRGRSEDALRGEDDSRWRSVEVVVGPCGGREHRLCVKHVVQRMDGQQ